MGPPPGGVGPAGRGCSGPDGGGGSPGPPAGGGSPGADGSDGVPASNVVPDCAESSSLLSFTTAPRASNTDVATSTAVLVASSTKSIQRKTHIFKRIQNNNSYFIPIVEPNYKKSL